MQFLYPNVFFMMLIPLILLFFLVITSKSTIEKHFTKEMLQTLRVQDNFLGKRARNSLLFVVLIFFIIALARPVINEKKVNTHQKLIPIVIALDVSSSMKAADIYPNRVALAKKKLQAFIEKANNATIGVVLYAKDSFVLSPVTEDFVSLQYMVQNLDTNREFTNGSNIFAPLEAAKYMLNDYTIKNLIILSDGGNSTDYTEALEFLKENKISVYSIGIATKNGAPIPTEKGYVTDSKNAIVTVALNESLRDLSLQSGGGYIEYTLDEGDVDAIIARINAQSQKEDLGVENIKIYTELFYYPLAFGIFLFFIALSSFPSLRKQKKSLQSVVFFVSCLSAFSIPSDAIGYTFDFEKIAEADEAYTNKEYSKAGDIYRTLPANAESLYNLGNSLYKEQKYEEALQVYNSIKTEKKDLEAKRLHNIGNSYVKSNNLEQAKQAYEKALEIQKDPKTQENLQKVNEALEKQKEQEKKEDQKSQNPQEQKENKEKKEDQKENKQKQENKENRENTEKKDQSVEKDAEKNAEKDAEKDAEKQLEKNTKNEEISDMEEKKWMQILQNQQTPLYLQKIETKKESNYDANEPW